MIKKYVVQYDDLGKPIEIVEVKEFAKLDELKNFQEKCKVNKVAYEQRVSEKEQKLATEKQNLLDRVDLLEKENKCLKSVISHILGYNELGEEEIKEILEVE